MEIPLNVSKIHNVLDSDSDDPGMASGFMTPPRKNEKVISMENAGDIAEELEAYLKSNNQEGDQNEALPKLDDQIPGSRQYPLLGSLSDKDKSDKSSCDE